MSDYEFNLPWPPSINGYRACVRNRLITSRKGREYFEAVRLRMSELNLTGELIEAPVLIHLTMHPPTKRKYDCSNFLKAYEDALVKCEFLEDDHWIEYSGIRKGEKVAGGKLVVKVTLI
ncbi:endodeoxyribonuclease [Vibrio phage 1.133.O._10N.222.51.E4]|nr:endodeoxyribonuclease [Vibrio phage 1.133.O._10N.222.51.E4]